MNEYIVETSTYRNLAIGFLGNAKFLEKACVEKGQTVEGHCAKIKISQHQML